MNSIQSLFQQAQLAEATYSDFSDPTRSTFDALTTGDGKFSTAQATAFVNQWRVADQYTASGLFGLTDGSGFSATLFETLDANGAGTGHYSFAARGTQVSLLAPLWADLSADIGDIVADGLAMYQIVDMYNYWQYLTHTGVYDAKVLDTDLLKTAELVAAYLVPGAGPVLEATMRADGYLIDNPSHTVLSVQTVPSTELSDAKLRTGIGMLPATAVVNVDGHSLGGHLAMAFSRLFPSATANVTAVNGAGFGLQNSNVDTLFVGLNGASGFDAGKITNAVGSAAMNVVSQDWLLLQQPAGRSEIYTESAGSSASFGHGASQMTDSLALYGLFATLDPRLNDGSSASLNKITRLLKAASNQATDTLERTVNALVDVFGLDFVPMSGALIGDREALYERVGALQTLTSSAGLTVDDLTGMDAADLANIAQGSEALAYRYALKKLNPFAIVGNNDLYASHNANGALNLYIDQSVTPAGMTSEYIADRAAMLGWLNVSKGQDLGPNIARNDVSGATNFQDRATDEWIKVYNPQSAEFRNVTFGGGGSEVIGGGALSDRLYGDGGTDFLQGKGGNDYLEGGTGLDLYQYGAQTNILFPNTNDGADTILDTDGMGVLRYTLGQGSGFSNTYTSTVIADASVKLSDTSWQSADGKFKYDKQGADLVVTILGDAGGSLRLENWRDGDFGIRLWEARSVPEITNTINAASYGDTETIFDTAGNDLILGDARDNGINASSGGSNWIQAGAGRDIVYALTSLVTDVHLIEGGAGDDLLSGGAGNDELYADTRVDLAQAITAGSNPGNGSHGDWLTGGWGDDVLVGDVSNDGLAGGRGKDIIVAGGGDDNVFGDADWLAATRDWYYQDDPATGERSFYFFNGTDNDDVGEADVVYAGSGDDYVWSQGGDDLVYGEQGRDELVGGGGADVLIGGADDDLLEGDASDLAQSQHGADYLDGGAGNDTLIGDGGDDILIGGPGVDILIGGPGRDIYVFNRGDGTETVSDTPAGANDPEASIVVVGDGVDRSDVKFRLGSLLVDFGNGDGIHFEGFDQLNPANSPVIGELRFADGTSMSYEDILAQGFDIDGTEDSDDNHDAAHPQLTGTGVTDRIRGLGGDDIIAGIGGDDTLDGGAGNDLIVGGAGADILIGGAGADQLQGGSGSDTLQGGDDADQLFGDADDATETTFGNDALDGGAGDDFLNGMSGEDTLAGGDGADTLYGASGSDSVEGGAGNDFLYGDAVYVYNGQPVANLFDDGAADTLRGGDGDDQLDAGGGDDTLEGGAGADTLFAGAGNDALSGGEGDDQLVAGSGEDTLAGGAGADTLFGEAGNDTYLFNLGDGRDVIVEDAALDTEVLRFGPGIASNDLTFSRSLGDLVISHANAADEVTIAGWYAAPAYQMTRLEFADGSVITAAEAGNRGLQLQYGTDGYDFIGGSTGNDTLYGLGGNDTIYGNGGDDRFIGGAGNDALDASEGNDTFEFAPGDGADTIRDTGGSDTLVFGAGIAKSEMTPSRLGGNLVLTRAGTQDKVTIRDWFNALANKVESVRFDGTGEAFSDAELVDPFLALEGTAGADTLLGGAYSETFNGYGGDDYIRGGGSDDDITGGPGNDSLYGDAGFDTFHFAAGDGQDTVYDADGRGVVHFGPGLVDKAVVTYLYSSTKIAFTGLTDSVLINDPNFSVKPKFDTIGTEGDDTIVGSAYNDVIQGLGGADAINGGNGADEIYGGEGNDLLEGGGSSTDYSRDSLYGGAGDDILDSGLRADGGDVGGSLTGGPGNDQLFGSSGRDSYFFNLGDGADIISDQTYFGNGQVFFSTEDELVFGPGITRDAIAARFSGADVIVQVSASDQVTLKDWTDISHRVDRFVFADGSSMNDAAIQELALTITGTAGNDTLTGTAQADTIRGLAGDDTIAALEGDDKITGGPGDDAIDGGPGNDRYFFNAGDGEDRITDASGSDTVQFGAGIGAGDVTLGRAADSLVLTLAGGADALTIDGYLADPAKRIEQFEFTDGSALPEAAAIVDALINIGGTAGSDTLVGTAGVDIISGFEGDDDIAGLAGNDTLLGGPGIDTYRFDAGDGIDLISDPDSGNRVLFGAGINPSGVMILRAGDQLTLIVPATGDQLSIQNYFSEFQVNEFGFTDGTVWTAQTIKDRLLTGTAGNDVLVGFDSDDTIQGFAGDDRLWGGAGNDILDGGTGSDMLYGEDGDDTLIAGNGDSARAGVANQLYGGAGNDLLIAGDTAANSMFGESGADLYLGGAGDDLMRDASGSSLFHAADGADQLAGSDQNEVYIGGKDEDTLDGDADANGIAGADIVLYNRNDGQDTAARLGQAAALSIGGLTSYRQLKLDRSGSALTVKVGHNGFTFSDWYDAGAGASRPVYLQLMTEGMRKYDPASADPLLNQKVQLFDLQGLIAAFDQAQAARQRFVVSDRLAQFRLWGSDTQAYGGAIAYQYGTTGALDALSTADMQTIVGDPALGLAPQSIGAPAGTASIAAFAVSADATDTQAAGPVAVEEAETVQGAVSTPAPDARSPAPSGVDAAPAAAHADSATGPDSVHGNSASSEARDAVADAIWAQLAQAPAYDFEALLRALDGAQGAGPSALTPAQIARRWAAIREFADTLSEDADEDARRAALAGWQHFAVAPGLGALGSGLGAGFAGLAGPARGIEALRPLQGLQEGLARLG